MSITLSVYTLEECIKSNPYPLLLLLFVYPAFGCLWKCSIGALSYSTNRPDGFIGTWLLSARFLLFYLCFFSVAFGVIEHIAYTTSPDTLGRLRIFTEKKETYPCLEEAHFRMRDNHPEMLWYDVPKFTLCLANLQGKKRLGPDWEPRHLSVSDYVEELFTALRLPAKNSDDPESR